MTKGLNPNQKKINDGKLIDWGINHGRDAGGKEMYKLLTNQTREKSEARIEKLDLPRYKRIDVSLKDFLKDPDTYCNQHDSSKFFAVLISQESNLERYTLMGKTKEELIEFAEGLPNQNFDMMLHNFYPNIYGGNVTIKDDRLLIEFHKGKHIHVARGTVPLKDLYHVYRDKLSRKFEYSFEDEELRKIIYEKIILNLPHYWEGLNDDNDKSLLFDASGNSPRLVFKNPGYYEFALCQKEGEEELRSIFFDYNPDISKLITDHPLDMSDIKEVTEK